MRVMLTDLADVCRAAGLTTIEVPGWRTRGHGQMTDVLGVTCHHTGGSPHGNAPSFTVVRDGRADLRGPLAHLLLARDGTVYVMAAGLCWHAGASLKPGYENGHRIGIEAENTGQPSDPWPGVQITAYAKLCAALARHYGFPVSEVLGHKETCAPVGRKPDPSFAMPAFRTRVATYYAAKPTQEDEMQASDKLKFRDAYLGAKNPKDVDQTLTVAQGIQRAYNYGSVALRDLAQFSAELSALRAEVAALKKGTKT